MFYLLKNLPDELFKTIKRPSRVLSLVRPRVIMRYFHSLKIKECTWSNTDSIQKRFYGSYQEYLKHQKSKLKIIELSEYNQAYREALSRRLTETSLIKSGDNVLCLAARLGAEVQAFIDLGCFAVGLDLNPGKDNKFVVSGDFHEIQYADSSVEIIFSNSLDHAFNLTLVAREIHRVLKQDGLVIIEAVNGRKEGSGPGNYESVFLG